MKHLLFIELNIRGEFLTERTIVGYKKYTLQVHECNMTMFFFCSCCVLNQNIPPIPPIVHFIISKCLVLIITIHNNIFKWSWQDVHVQCRYLGFIFTLAFPGHLNLKYLYCITQIFPGQGVNAWRRGCATLMRRGGCINCIMYL